MKKYPPDFMGSKHQIRSSSLVFCNVSAIPQQTSMKTNIREHQGGLTKLLCDKRFKQPF